MNYASARTASWRGRQRLFLFGMHRGRGERGEMPFKEPGLELFELGWV